MKKDYQLLVTGEHNFYSQLHTTKEKIINLAKAWEDVFSTKTKVEVFDLQSNKRIYCNEQSL